MPRLRRRISDERGFTLIELLAVMVIIGLLAAIALSTFFGHKDRGEDAVAKSDARVLVTQVESCFAAEFDYTKCDTPAELGALEIVWGTDGGEASVTNTTKTSYEISGYSKSVAGGSRHAFTIKKDVTTGEIDQTCTPEGNGGCPESGEW